jgi:nitrile hydratase accessory protein
MTKEPDPAQVRDVLNTVPSVPNDGEAPVFGEPWQAEAFAIALSLHQEGVFTWTEWAETLGDEIQKARAAGDPDDGSTYYNHWMATLEQLVDEKGLTTSATLDTYSKAWGRAAERTPHGSPIALQPADFK